MKRGQSHQILMGAIKYQFNDLRIKVCSMLIIIFFVYLVGICISISLLNKASNW